jgi:capsular polysaccharide biosynthesis protein
LEEITLEEQISADQGAEIVIGAHGAGLTNIIFCNPGAKVLQIVPFGASNWYFRNLALSCRHIYDCFIDRILPSLKNSDTGSNPWMVSINHVIAALDYYINEASKNG